MEVLAEIQNVPSGAVADPKHTTKRRDESERVEKIVPSQRSSRINRYDDFIQMKNRRQAIARSRSRLFLSLGFVITFLVLWLAFEWKTYDPVNLMDLGSMRDAEFEEIIEIPLTAQLPPPPPKVIRQPIIKEVSNEVVLNEIEIEIDVEISEDDVVEEIDYDNYDTDADYVEEVVEEVFMVVEHAPGFKGGMEAFYEYISENLEYPRIAKRQQIEGRVFLRFVIEKDGSVGKVDVLKGIGGGCDEEAVRVVKSSPKWTPGKQRGKAVRVYMALPILFNLE